LTSNLQLKTRFFNKIDCIGDSDVLKKSSKDIDKIKSEYEFYSAVPKNLKKYFVEAFDYKEDKTIASYCMPKIEAKNVAEQIVLSSMSDKNFSKMFSALIEFQAEMYLHYSQESLDLVSQNSYDLVVKKSKQRVSQLLNTPWVLSTMCLQLENAGISASRLLDRLETLHKELSNYRTEGKIVFSHGDLTFSNVLWNSQSNTLKLIDPKGIDYMFLDEYYDVAKLSQSILGRYDDIIYGKYRVDLEAAEIYFDRSLNDLHCNIFNTYIETLGLSGRLVRLYEASLFLSMTPLHLEDHGRVAAFLIRCNQILDDIS
jgi:hypothetical protein